MKKHILLVLKTLINNNACVEASRTKQIKYNVIAIIFAIIGVFLAVLPTGVNSFKLKGSDWINLNYVNNCDVGMYGFCDTCNTNEVKFMVQDDKTLQVTGDWNQATDPTHATGTAKDTENWGTGDNALHPYVYRSPNDGSRAFEVWNLTNCKDDTEFAEYYTYIVNNLNPILMKAGKKNTDAETWIEFTWKDDKKQEKSAKVTRTSSAIFFGKNYVFVYMATSTSAGKLGDYKHTASGDLISRYFTDAVKNKPAELLKAWAPFFDESYINVRWNNSWRSIGIMLGVDFGVLLFMGLMVFILTRGKNNPFRIYSFWDSQKIAYYASFTPSLLALIFGFIMSQMAMMFYVLAIGIRVMWLSMRTLRPEGAMQK